MWRVGHAVTKCGLTIGSTGASEANFLGFHEYRSAARSTEALAIFRIRNEVGAIYGQGAHMVPGATNYGRYLGP